MSRHLRLPVLLPTLTLAAFWAPQPCRAQAPEGELAVRATAAEQDATAPPDKRIFGVLPNYRTADASRPIAPLTAKQKFYIGYKDSTDYPVFILGGMFAGLSQLQGSNPTYGGGMAGFGKRYASAYADQAIGNIMTESLFPTVLREDPRYYRKGTGSVGSRTIYALTRIFVTRTDAGAARFNFSEVIGNAAAAGISTAYSPETRSAGAAGQKLAMQLGTDALGGVLKEFWPDVKKFFAKGRT